MRECAFCAPMEGSPTWGWTTCTHVRRRLLPAVMRMRRGAGPKTRPAAEDLRVLVVHPAHELAQLTAGGLQQVVAVGLLVLVVLGQTVVVLGHPVLGEGAVL